MAVSMIGTSGHLGGELLKNRLGIAAVTVPYKGAAPATNDLLAGQVDFTVENVITVAPLVKAGRLRALAVTTRERSQILPDVPTLAEQGYPDIDVGAWLGVLVSAKTPPAVVARLNEALNAALADPDVKQQLAQQGGIVRAARRPSSTASSARKRSAGKRSSRPPASRRSDGGAGGVPAPARDAQGEAMAIDYQRLRAWTFDDRVDRYTARDCMIYALGLGYGGDPLDEAELRYVHEQDTAVAPTFLATVGAPTAGRPIRPPASTGCESCTASTAWRSMPLPAQAEVRSRTRVTRVVDKGARQGRAGGHGARDFRRRSGGQPLATVEHVSFCRADGGFGAGDEPPPALPAPPERAPRRVRAAAHAAAAGAAVPAEWRPQPGARRAAHGARGGLRPAHPAWAVHLWHGRPRALARACSQGGKRLASIATRFSAPFFPGETLRVDIWRDGGRLQFRAWAQERGVAVLNNGVAELAA